MGVSVAQIGFGMTLGYCDTQNGSYTTLVDLIEIKPHGFKVGKAEATHHSSPNVAEEYLPSTIDYNELECQVSWVKTAYLSFINILRQVKYWRVTYPDGSTDTFQGFITEVGPATPLKERMTCTLKIQPKGLSTFLAAS